MDYNAGLSIACREACLGHLAGFHVTLFKVGLKNSPQITAQTTLINMSRLPFTIDQYNCFGRLVRVRDNSYVHFYDLFHEKELRDAIYAVVRNNNVLSDYISMLESKVKYFLLPLDPDGNQWIHFQLAIRLLMSVSANFADMACEILYCTFNKELVSPVYVLEAMMSAIVTKKDNYESKIHRILSTFLTNARGEVINVFGKIDLLAVSNVSLQTELLIEVIYLVLCYY